ncbi:GNAT family N-acetyltransferase [Ornithinimicrobium panacihumi]|uniref:GNAT family N-acetyltransferase n=1 Tax=Ornithinimicrobium panacihumi TaxID=2008449 RepID=UPI003F8B9E86
MASRLELVDALNAVALAGALAEQDRSWGTETLAVAGGYLVLSGRGLYVNRAIAAGITEPLEAADIELVMERSAAAGVRAEIEVTPVTHPQSLAALRSYGFGPDAGAGTSVHVYPLDRLPAQLSHPGVRMAPVNERSLEEWQEVSAAGWGHESESARGAADAFARAAHAVDGDGMIIALDEVDGRPLGCASLTIREDVATLGGMSTLPAERGRGVQAALILHRLGVARDASCSLAMATTALGGASERNLQRFGFVTTHIKQTYWRQLPGS